MKTKVLMADGSELLHEGPFGLGPVGSLILYRFNSTNGLTGMVGALAHNEWRKAEMVE